MVFFSFVALSRQFLLTFDLANDPYFAKVAFTAWHKPEEQYKAVATDREERSSLDNMIFAMLHNFAVLQFPFFIK